MIRFILLSFFISVTCIACSGNSADQNSASEQNTGGIAFGLALKSGLVKAADATVEDSSICTEINTVVVSVLDVNKTLIEEQWPCSLGSGTITGITPGPIALIVKGFRNDATGRKIYLYQSGEYHPVIEAGKRTQMGTISLQLATDQDDWDADGYTPASGDCNDGESDIHPGAEEKAYDGIDQDCRDGDLVDVDGDGYDAAVAGGPDLDDNNAGINPGVEEVCNDQIDNNSNGLVDDGCPWNKTFRMNGMIDDMGLAVIQANDHDGYVVAGYTLFQTPPFIHRPWIMKIDEEGNQQWRISPEVSIDATNPDINIVQAHDGGYVMAGSIGLVKVSEDGSMAEGWNQSYGRSGSDHFHTIIQSPDGGYVAVGESYSEITQSTDMWLFKIDVDGNEIDGFDKKFDLGSNSNDRAFAIDRTSDGGYIITGNGDFDAWILKTDDKGNELWRQNIQAGNVSCSVVQDRDAGYVVAGPIGKVTSGDIVLGTTFTWLQKFDEAGNQLWFKYIPDPHYLYPDTLPSVLTSFTLANDGQYVVSGNGLASAAFILKTGADADPMKWRKDIGPIDNNDKNIYSVIQSNDQRGYILAGSIAKEVLDPLYGSQYRVHAWLIKTDENGDAPAVE